MESGKSLFGLLAMLCLLISCVQNKKQISSQPEAQKSARLIVKDSLIIPSKISIRGLDIDESGAVWFSGPSAIWGRYMNGKWHTDSCPTKWRFDFRDVEALGESNAIIMSVGSPARIYLLEIGENGESQAGTTYHNDHPDIFLDGMDFWNGGNGIAFGDPLDDGHLLMMTTDHGNSWTRIPTGSLPDSLTPEAGFAASGTSIVCVGDSTAIVGFGGKQARVLITHDRGISWKAVKTPVLHGESSQGIYSLAFANEEMGVAVGGQWDRPDSCPSSRAYTLDGGTIWKPGTGVDAYRSCVTYVRDSVFIASGRTGTDISYNGGKTWELLDSTGYFAINFAEGKLSGAGTRRTDSTAIVEILELSLAK